MAAEYVERLRRCALWVDEFERCTDCGAIRTSAPYCKLCDDWYWRLNKRQW